MEYDMKKNKEYTIKSLMEEIANNKLCLPIIQRDFCWEPKYIELLFDSLMRDYPIGYFLLWEFDNEKLGKYSFYGFRSDVNSDDIFASTELREHQSEGAIAVLDGQQRMASMYIGLYGSYTTKKTDGSPMKKKLYLNLFSNNDQEEKHVKVIEKLYDFKFKTDEEVERENSDASNLYYWFEVSEVLVKSFNIENYISGIEDKELRKLAKRNLKLLKENICNNTEIFVFKRIKKDKTIHEVLEMFERINHLGKELSKTDLLFSAFVAESPELRSRMVQLITTCNIKTNNNYKSKIGIDTIIQSCIIMNKETIKIKLDTITTDLVKDIEKNWTKYEKPIIKFFEILNEIKIFPKTFNAIYSIYPVIYFIKKGNKITDEIKKNIKKYIILSHLKRIYSTHSDTRVDQMIDAINNNKIKVFSYSELKKLTIDKTVGLFKVTEEDINNWLIKEKYGKSSDVTLNILSLIQSDYDNVTNYDQDHLHPKNPRSDEQKKLTIQQLDTFKNLKNGIGNLQIINKGINRSEKNNMPLIEACSTKNKLINVQFSSLRKEKYDIVYFEEFYINRINNIKTKLRNCFGIRKYKHLNKNKLLFEEKK